jgi:predicted acylesterase/phospholipase RssA
MPYVIELLSVGCDRYPLLELSAKKLNAVQKSFDFRPVQEGSSGRTEAINYSRNGYVTTEIFDFVIGQRTKFGGNRPFIIAFVDAPLKGEQLTNLFGSHRANQGLAIVTFDRMAQYVKEESRFCCYYLVRYALSFVNPSIQSHTDPGRATCYFNKKIDKREIRLSMDSGIICDDCLYKLQTPPASNEGTALSADEMNALAKMRLVVSGDYPHAIVMKGGGVKGLAFAGALRELEQFYWFDRHVGASAGAITAILLAAGYAPDQLASILNAKAFRDFMDSSWWKVPFNLLFKWGLYPGEHFRLWIAGLIGEKTQKMGETLMKDLNGALIYATRRGPGTLEFDSTGAHSDTVAAFAVRCSMSIPLFFVPQMFDGRRAFDGGLRNNFPLQRFITSHPNKPFVAIYLGKRDDRNRRWLGAEMLEIFIDGEERTTVDNYRDSVVVIDTSPIGTVDFNLTDKEKRFLIAVGRAAAVKFLLDRKFDDGPAESIAEEAQREAEALRANVMVERAQRRRGRVYRSLWIVAGMVVTVALFWVFRALHG